MQEDYHWTGNEKFLGQSDSILQRIPLSQVQVPQLKHTWYAKPCSPIKQVSSLQGRLRRGNKYIMVMAEINSDAILVKPMKTPHQDNEELQGCQDDTGIRCVLAPTKTGRHCPKETCPWRQWSIRKHEKPYLWHIQFWHETSANGMPPMQCSQGSHM